MSSYTELAAQPMSPKRRHLHECFNWMLTGLSEHFKDALSWEREIYAAVSQSLPPLILSHLRNTKYESSDFRIVFK